MAAVTAQTIANEAYRDLGGMRSGMGMSSDIAADFLAALNEIVDAWSQERLFVYLNTGAILPTFAALGTSYNLAPGYQRALRKSLAISAAEMMKTYFKVPEPLLQEIAVEADALKLQLEGIGVA